MARFLFGIAVCAASVWAPNANAGAWIAPEGGQSVSTSAVGQRDGIVFYEGSGYWEFPAGDDTSFVVAPWMEQNYDTIDGWRAEATVGAKRMVLRRGPYVAAVQGGALWVSHPAPECGEWGGEARVLAGRGFGETGFVNVEAATRAVEGGCESDRLDLTVGYRPAENWLGMAQLFVDAPREGDEILRGQLTLVRFGESGRGIQVGVRARLDGGSEEAALVIGLWGRPRG